MRRVLLSVLGLMALTIVSYSATNAVEALAELKAQVEPIQTEFSSTISTKLAPHLGFYTGSGNVLPVNETSFLGLKLGLGLGIMMNETWLTIIQDQTAEALVAYDASQPVSSLFATVGNAAALLPFPYDQVYAKIGVPVLPLDIGIRVGVLPSMSFAFGDTTVGFGSFHFGGEARYKLLDLGILKTDVRLSFDYNAGNIDVGFTQTTNVTTSIYGVNVPLGDVTYGVGMNYAWSGVSIGPKVMASLDLLVINIFAGAGLNFNFGEANTTFTTKLTVTPDSSTGLAEVTDTIIGSGSSAYNLMDFRLLIGAQFLVFNIAAEYGPITGDWSVNLIPVALSF